MVDTALETTLVCSYAKEHYGAKYVLIANPDVEFEESLVYCAAK